MHRVNNLNIVKLGFDAVFDLLGLCFTPMENLDALSPLWF